MFEKGWPIIRVKLNVGSAIRTHHNWVFRKVLAYKVGTRSIFLRIFLFCFIFLFFPFLKFYISGAVSRLQCSLLYLSSVIVLPKDTSVLPGAQTKHIRLNNNSLRSYVLLKEFIKNSIIIQTRRMTAQ